MKIKKGDTVIVLSGSDKGTKGEVIVSLPRESRVLIDGVNVRTGVGMVGNKKTLVKKPYPIHVSKVALLDPKTNKATRVGYVMEGGKKLRIAKKSGTTIK
jgi:large subunit ribosomal protein L24